MTYVIQDDVPIPFNDGKRGPCSDGKFARMSDLLPGQSFLVPCSPEGCAHLASNLMGNGRRISKVRGDANMKFCTRKVEGGVRVWRVS